MRFLVLFIAIFMAAPALAAETTGSFTDCLGTATTNTKVGSTTLLCYEFTSADTGPYDTAVFTVTADTALISHDPDTLATGVPVDGGVVEVYHCAARIKPTTGSLECDFIRALTGGGLTGLGGTGGTQNKSIRVAPGMYFFRITTDAAAGDTARIAIQGE